jgi:Secretion system C-terminal sorting domain
MYLKSIFSATMLWALAQIATAQCTFNPTVVGDSLLCPGDTTVFSTQEYDSYQWYRRVYPDGTPTAITGATQQTLTLGEADLLYYYWVEATDQGCTEASPEKLLDGYVFLLPFVVHSGNYEFDPDLEAFKICEGDTMFLQFNYGSNVTWFKNGEPIPDETGTLLAITEPGAYTVEGAPGTCPNFIQSLGLIIDVVVVNCTSPVRPEPAESQIAIYPNPASDWLMIEVKSNELLDRAELINAQGQVVAEINLAANNKQQISLQNLQNGIYYVRINHGGSVVIKKFTKQ